MVTADWTVYPVCQCAGFAAGSGIIKADIGPLDAAAAPRQGLPSEIGLCSNYVTGRRAQQASQNRISTRTVHQWHSPNSMPLQTGQRSAHQEYHQAEDERQPWMQQAAAAPMQRSQTDGMHLKRPDSYQERWANCWSELTVFACVLAVRM